LTLDLTDSLPTSDKFRTPERIEFENSVDFREETEEEQTSHNLGPAYSPRTVDQVSAAWLTS